MIKSFEAGHWGGFISALKVGVDVETAALANGVSCSLLYSLLERGKAEEIRIGASSKKPLKTQQEALEIWQCVSKAQASAKAEVQANLFKATREEWRAAQGWLSVRDFQNFGNPVERAKMAELGNKLTQLESGRSNDV